MLHPITCENLSKGDQHDRAVQREEFQLRNKLGAAGAKYPSLLAQWANALGTLLVTMGARLIAWQIPPSSQVSRKARG
jgi:hypothetical protein